MQYYNVHTHSFTGNNAPKDFLNLFVPASFAKLVNNITETELGAFLVQHACNLLGDNLAKRYASFLRIGKSKNQLEVFRLLRDQYTDKSFKFVVLTMFMEQCGAGSSTSGYAGQLEEAILVKRRFPDNVLLFMGIDPRWQNSGTALRKTVQAYFDTKVLAYDNKMVYPFVGLKLYPSMGFYPFDEKLTETFEWAADNQVPLLAHCNYLGGIYNNDVAHIDRHLKGFDSYTNSTYPKNGISYTNQKSVLNWLMGRQGARNNRNKCSYFMEPAAFESVLNHFKRKNRPLKLCLAHFGGGNQISALLKIGKARTEETTPYGSTGVNWYCQVRDMMQRFDSLYTDISYALHDPKLHDNLIKDIQDASIGDRIMFGTDYFLTEREGPEKKTFEQFQDVAIDKQPCWDKSAHFNVENFLHSKYY